MYLIDYVRANKRTPFAVEPFNEVDACAFATISYLALDGIVSDRMAGEDRTVTEVSRLYAAAYGAEREKLGLFTPEDFVEVLLEMGGSARYGDIRLFGYRRKWDAASETQFNAVGMQLADGTLVLSIAGTDDTLIGWKEDLNLACNVNVEGQFSAVRYVNDVLSAREGKFVLCGYSKGGNFAVYAAAMCDAPERLLRLYDFDGPGFVKSFIESEAFSAIRDRCLLLLPRCSAVGAMLFNLPHYAVTRCDRRGLLQHDCSRWEVADVRFARVPSLSEESKRFHRQILAFLEETTVEQRRTAIDNGFEVARESGLLTLTELHNNRMTALRRMTRAFNRLEPSVKRTTTSLFFRFIRMAAENFTGKR